MKIAFQALADICMENGFADSAKFEQLITYLWTGKQSPVGNLDVVGTASYFRLAKATSPNSVEQVRQYIDAHRKRMASDPPSGASDYVYNPASQTGLQHEVLTIADVKGDPSLIEFVCDESTEYDRIQFENNFNLQRVVCQNLEHVIFNLSLINNFSLNVVDIASAAPELTIGTSFEVAYTRFLAAINVPKLKEAFRVVFVDNWATSFDLAGFTNTVPIEGNPEWTKIYLQDNRFTSISFPAFIGELIRCDVEIYNEAYATLVSFPVMINAGSIIVQSSRPSTISFPSLVDSMNIEFTTLHFLTLIQFTLLESAYGQIVIDNCDALLSFQFPQLTNIRNGGLTVKNNSSLIFFSLPALTYCSWIEITNNASLQTIPIILSGLEGPRYILVEDNPQLDKFQCNTSAISAYGSIRISNNDQLAYIRLPYMTQCLGSITVSNNPVLGQIALDSLSYIQGDIVVDNCPTLTSFTMPHMARNIMTRYCRPPWYTECTWIQTQTAFIGNISVTRCTSLTTIDLGDFLPSNWIGNNTFDFSWCAFTSTFINSFLARCVASNDFNTGTIDFRLNPFGPSGQGVIDKATLIARGVTVLTI